MIVEMKLDSEQMMRLEWLYKVGSECELSLWPEWNSVVVSSNPTPANFL